jgi:hypothetical protein
MTTDEKLDKLTDLVGNIAISVKQLTGTVETLAGSIAAHDAQIESLIQIAEKHAVSIAALERQWQAYITRLPRQ